MVWDPRPGSYSLGSYSVWVSQQLQTPDSGIEKYFHVLQENIYGGPLNVSVVQGI